MRLGLDGLDSRLDGVRYHMTNTLNTPIEATERAFPVLTSWRSTRPAAAWAILIRATALPWGVTSRWTRRPGYGARSTSLGRGHPSGGVDG